MRQVRGILIALLLALAACGGGGDSTADTLARAKAEAKKVAPDAVLVSIEFSNFGFATGANGIPDMTKAGPPQLALFNFHAPGAAKGLRVVADINRAPLPAEFAKLQEQQGYKDVRVEQGDVPYTPFTLPLPDAIGDLDKAIAAARDTIQEECAGGPQFSTCSLVQSAELHMHWAGQEDKTGTPVWTVSFGQNPKTYETVRRLIADAGDQPYTGGDAQRLSYDQKDEAPLHEVDLKVGRDFDALWPLVVAAVQKQDPLYAPYAVSLITYLEDARQYAGGNAELAEAHIVFARLTPSLIWDEVEAHVGWRNRSSDDAVLFFSEPRRHAMGEPRPVTLKEGELPKAAPALKDLLANFPKDYAEVITSWSEGCEDILTFLPDVTMWRCGVMGENKTKTDLVFLWLTHQGNPAWKSGRAPLPAEFAAVTEQAPKESWVWWTRVKHPDEWAYFLLDAATGKPAPGFCTTPDTGAGAVRFTECRTARP